MITRRELGIRTIHLHEASRFQFAVEKRVKNLVGQLPSPWHTRENNSHGKWHLRGVQNRNDLVGNLLSRHGKPGLGWWIERAASGFDRL